jgi:hypothetical protein
MSGPPEALMRIQRQFAGHIRDPEGVAPLAGLEARRLAIYRRLVFNNVSRLMASNFPVIKRLCTGQDWNELIAEFVRVHRAETPLFPQIAHEMVRYLQRLHEAGCLPLPFLAELAHWEALETGVRLHPADLGVIAPGREVDPVRARPILNPTLSMAMYAWPVHLIGPRYQPSSPAAEPIILLACRKRDETLAFQKLNVLSACLIETMQARPAAGVIAHLEAIAERLAPNDSELIIGQGLLLIQRLLEAEVVLSLEPLSSTKTSTPEIS